MSEVEEWWCVDCGCAPEDHGLTGCGSCGDCYHPHMQRVSPSAETENQGEN